MYDSFGMVLCNNFSYFVLNLGKLENMFVMFLLGCVRLLMKLFVIGLFLRLFVMIGIVVVVIFVVCIVDGFMVMIVVIFCVMS